MSPMRLRTISTLSGLIAVLMALSQAANAHPAAYAATPGATAAATTAATALATPSATPTFPKTPLFIGANNRTSYTEGDIWSWTGGHPVRRTFNSHNLLPVIAPTGDWLAYLQIAPVFVRQRASPLDDTSDQEQPPTDVYLYNVKTSASVKIAGQPDKPGFALDGSATYTIRSQPSWSPDTSLLAWTEITLDPDVNPTGALEQLVVYNVATQTSQVIVSPLPAHRGVPNFPVLSEVAFGPEGRIAVQVRSSLDVDSNGSDAIYFYDLTGTKLSEADAITAQDHGYANSQLIWLTGEDQPYLSCVVCSTQIGPDSATVTPLNGTPEMYSPNAPDKLSLYYGSDAGTEANVEWIIALNGKQVSTFAAVRLAQTSDAAISPDGMEVGAASFSGQGSTAGVILFNGNTFKTDGVTINVTGLAWGPVAWRIFPVVAPAQ